MTSANPPRVRPLQVDVTVSSLAPGGDGVAHIDLEGERRAVFIPHTVPGDRARVAIDASRRPARGRVVVLTSPGTDRADPVCAWSTRCGGCDWMHLSMEAQARTHVEHVRAALPVSWRGLPIASAAAPTGVGYRTRARVHVRSADRGKVLIGMHEARSNDPVEVDACAVLAPALEATRRALTDVFAGVRGRGEVQLALGVGGIPVLDVRWDGDLPPSVFARLEQAVAAGALAGAQVTMGDASRPARVGDPTPWMTAADGAPLRLAAGGFGQASEAMNTALARHVAALVRPWNVERAAELYAGAGNLSVLLARETKDLACVESSREAVDAARANLRARGLEGARVVEADAESYAWSKGTKLVVLDPPRTGARAVAERLVAPGSRVAHVIYVSCDAQTLGRDLAILEGTYTATSVATFEMFPQTSHVEVVVALARDAIVRRP